MTLRCIHRGGSSGVGGALTPTSTNFDSTTFEKGPQIDTWTNDTAEKPTEKDEIGGRCRGLDLLDLGALQS